jgi:two-component system, sensor histidine kinase and response regulator
VTDTGDRIDEIARVLLVDDRPDNLLALEAVLEPLGLELVCASSGQEALRELLGREFATVLLDVQMPDMDGFETARLIKAREKTRYLPIIFLTAISGELEHHLQGYRSGAVDYVHKPFSPEILRAKVEVFAELWRRGRLIASQTEALAVQLETVARLNAELERSNLALERFALVAAEQLQEPLDNVSGFLELLSVRAGTDEQLLIERAGENAARVRARVASLLEFARAGREPVHRERIELEAVVADAVRELEPGLLDAGATVEISELPAVRADRLQVTRLFVLLLDNVVRHRGDTKPTVTVDASRQRDAWVVRVTDTGPGIDDATRAELFALFSGTRHRGSGLAIARRIVERHGGAIWAEPRAAGAEIAFTLPDTP